MYDENCTIEQSGRLQRFIIGHYIGDVHFGQWRECNFSKYFITMIKLNSIAQHPLLRDPSLS